MVQCRYQYMYIVYSKTDYCVKPITCSTYSNLAVSGSCSSSSLTGDLGMLFKYLSVGKAVYTYRKETCYNFEISITLRIQVYSSFASNNLSMFCICF